jgi:hypothetical protein
VTPVELVSPEGRPFTARTIRELNNLRARGYRDAAPAAPATSAEQTPPAQPLAAVPEGVLLLPTEQLPPGPAPDLPPAA